MKVAAYVRVSTGDGRQTTANQTREIEQYISRHDGWKIVETYDDTGKSGTKRERPELNRMLDDARKGRFDIVCVVRIDRLARSTADLLDILTTLSSLPTPVGFVATAQAIDTSTSYGKMVLTFLSAVAEFEASVIRERVRSGIARSRAESPNKAWGRPRKGFDVHEAIRLKQDGIPAS